MARATWMPNVREVGLGLSPETVDPHSNPRVLSASKYASEGGVGPVRNADRKTSGGL